VGDLGLIRPAEYNAWNIWSAVCRPQDPQKTLTRRPRRSRWQLRCELVKKARREREVIPEEGRRTHFVLNPGSPRRPPRLLRALYVQSVLGLLPPMRGCETDAPSPTQNPEDPNFPCWSCFVVLVSIRAQAPTHERGRSPIRHPPPNSRPSASVICGEPLMGSSPNRVGEVDRNVRIRADTSKPGTRITLTWSDALKSHQVPMPSSTTPGATNIMFSRARWAWNRETSPSVSIRVIRVLVLRNHALDRSTESDGDRFSPYGRPLRGSPEG
jgi:hypothetical protein